MVWEMESDSLEEMDIEVLPSMWPEDLGNEAGKKFNVDKPGVVQDMLEEVTIPEEPTIVDFMRLSELTNYSEKGSSQLNYLVKHWEYKQANAVRLLREELDNLSKQRLEVELKKREILEQHRFEDESCGDKRLISILDDVLDIWQDAPRRKNHVVVQNKRLEIDAEYDTVIYWKQRSMHLEKLLEASVQREQMLIEKLEESIKNLEKQSSPVDELSQILKRADNFLHFILQTAPVVIGHQDKELRYRFIYNHFPSLQEEEIIGKTDLEIFTGAGVKESHDFKKEVLERGIPAKREITFETELFGLKTFLIYVEPVFSKAGDTIGVNYMGMEITDQVRKREKMAKLREEIAVQKAKETELNKTIHITEETMRAKQMLATMSHEIRSPLSGVVSMAEILATTKLDREQRQLLDVMLSSGDLVLQLINDILDLSKVESGVMKLEAAKFRPREVIKHVLQTAAASLKKILILEGQVAEDVPVEVIGDVLRIRQILTNLISNAIKFTHEGKVGIKLYVVADPYSRDGCDQKFTAYESTVPAKEKCLSLPRTGCDKNNIHDPKHGNGSYENCTMNGEPRTPVKHESSTGDKEQHPHVLETTVWLRCDVYDTGIGIPENALPTLFKKYMQVSADHARKYGGTGLGLAICKQLVELMGGHLTVSSRVHCGSTFTFVLPYKVSPTYDHSDDSDELSYMADHENGGDASTDDTNIDYFQFQPRTLGSLFSSDGSGRTQKQSSSNIGCKSLHKLNGFSENLHSFPSNSSAAEEVASNNSASLIKNLGTLSEPSCSLPQSSRPDNEIAVSNDKLRQDRANGQFQNTTSNSSHCLKGSKEMGEMANKNEIQETFQRHKNSDRNSQSISGSTPEVPKSILKPKILLVEDNKINVMVTKSMMKQLGHSIDVVNNGVEAVRAVQHHSYDLILMDVCMPVMDGLQATRLIRSFEETSNWDAAVQAGIEQSVPTPDSLPNGKESMPSTKRIPIIAMTANALAESADECFANGMDSFVSKPVTFQKLKECLQQYLT
ncbi:histidine kinase 5 [Malania oleifera]|uniref:histidine kinase 5 n=1 Tax=Malania oleifera TaxID=397392 RepID=UPI0025AE1FE9|nr:histidine kinase 5 [Malania oleifera]